MVKYLRIFFFDYDNVIYNLLFDIKLYFRIRLYKCVFQFTWFIYTYCCIAIYGDTFFCGCCFSKACTKKFHSAIICKNAQLLFKKNNKDIELNIVSNSNDILIKSKNAFALNKSKKKDTQNHGYGQKIISDIAKKYNGTYTTKAENEYFSTVTQLNNIDLNE